MIQLLIASEPLAAYCGPLLANAKLILISRLGMTGPYHIIYLQELASVSLRVQSFSFAFYLWFFIHPSVTKYYQEYSFSSIRFLSFFELLDLLLSS